MSRYITIKVKFNNNKSRQVGIYNPTNAEYMSSKLSYDDLIELMYDLEQSVKGKKIKDIEVTIGISTGSSKDLWEKCTLNYKNLLDISACKLVDINHTLYVPHIK